MVLPSQAISQCGTCVDNAQNMLLISAAQFVLVTYSYRWDSLAISTCMLDGAVCKPQTHKQEWCRIFWTCIYGFLLALVLEY